MSAPPEFVPADFFVLRTPLWAFSLFELWSHVEVANLSDDDVELEFVYRRDRERLRGFLRDVLHRPDIRTALLVAAPDLEAGLSSWECDPDGKDGARVEHALVRYFTRMTTRATPFGLFAANTVGRLGGRTELALGPREQVRRRTRLDMDYLHAIAQSLVREPAIRRRLRFRPNDTLYRAAGRLRYVEARGQGAARALHLVAAEPSEYLEATLARAAAGATIAELAAPLARDFGVTGEEAQGYVGQLIESQILVSDLAPPVTSTDALGDLVEVLRARGVEPGAIEPLEALRRRLTALDAAELSTLAEGYRGLAAELPERPPEAGLPYLFQVDTARPALVATLGPAVLAELARGATLLHRITPLPADDDLERFRTAFEERYGTQEVPLAEALDPEIGVSPEASDPRAEHAPWLEGLAFPDGAGDARQRRTRQLHGLLARTRSSQGAEVAAIELDEQDLQALEVPGRTPLPDAFAVMATLVPTADAQKAPHFQVCVEFVLGPSGARLLGRFCDTDPELRAATERHLRAQEALHPGAIFAEIVHMPEGRLGNVVCRPPLGEYEIPLLGRSGVPPERQIPLADLRVSVADGRIVLRSARLDREVIPRLTSAHNYRFRTIHLYRFLCALQSQGVSEQAHWDWGALDSAPYLPRVTHGRLVLARARWRVVRSEWEPLAQAQGIARVLAVRAWRATRRLPRHVLLSDFDNRLLVDLENPLSLDSFLQLVRARDDLTLLECLPGPGELVSGADGRYAHEILVPFVRVAAAVPDGRTPRGAPAALEPPAAAGTGVVAVTGAAGATEAVRRVFPPGSEWLFAKLYTGVSTADRVIRGVIAPWIEDLGDRLPGAPWFFLRYGDPAWHLRLRLHGEPGWLRTVAAPALEARVAPLLADRSVWRLSYDTYQREIERYGGAAGIEPSERLFAADSACALDLVALLVGDAGLETRSLIALCGADRLLEDFGFAPAERRAILWTVRESLARRLRVDRAFERRLDAAFRRRRPLLERSLGARDPADPELGPAWERLNRRSAAVTPIAGELAAAARTERLTAPLEAVAASHVHMQCNRLLRGAHLEQELVIYDALCRLYDSREARRRAQPARAATPA